MKNVFIILFLFLTSCETLKNISGYQSEWTPEQIEAEKKRRTEYTANLEQPSLTSNDGSFDESIEICKNEIQNSTSKDERKCDILTYQFQMDRAEFAAKCLKKKSKQECNKMYSESFIAKFELEYPNANWTEVNKWCKSVPLECDQSTVEGMVYFERLTYRSQLSHERAEKARMQQIERQRIGAALQAFSAEMSRNAQIQQQQMHEQQMTNQLKQTNCTSQRIGNVIQTNCR